jgi:DNA primase
LVIPFYNESKELIGVQGRSLEANSKVRYITLKKDSVEKLWYGLWRVNPQETIYITEGPIDSIFLPNAVAMVGAAGDMKLPEKIANSEVVYVFATSWKRLWRRVIRFLFGLMLRSRILTTMFLRLVIRWI